MRVRDRLIELVNRSGLSQSEIARRIGESPTWINHRMIGRTEIKADELPRIAAALNVPVSAFFETDKMPIELAAERAADRAVAKIEILFRDLRAELYELKQAIDEIRDDLRRRCG